MRVRRRADTTFCEQWCFFATGHVALARGRQPQPHLVQQQVSGSVGEHRGGAFTKCNTMIGSSIEIFVVALACGACGRLLIQAPVIRHGLQ